MFKYLKIFKKKKNFNSISIQFQFRKYYFQVDKEFRITIII